MRAGSPGATAAAAVAFAGLISYLTRKTDFASAAPNRELMPRLKEFQSVPTLLENAAIVALILEYGSAGDG